MAVSSRSCFPRKGGQKKMNMSDFFYLALRPFIIKSPIQIIKFAAAVTYHKRRKPGAWSINKVGHLVEGFEGFRDV